MNHILIKNSVCSVREKKILIETAKVACRVVARRAGSSELVAEQNLMGRPQKTAGETNNPLNGPKIIPGQVATNQFTMSQEQT